MPTLAAMNNVYLIVGGSSVSGGTAISAVRKRDSGALVYSTTSSSKELSAADHTIKNIDLDDKACVTRIKSYLGDQKVNKIIYIPARGEVAMPTHLATKEQVEAAMDYSVRPMLYLHAALQPERTICLSGFITMEPLLECYGAMGFVKIAMERLAVANPQKLCVIRIGMFISSSVRGIALLVQRRAMQKAYPEFEKLYTEWKGSHKKFSQFFYDKNYKFEKANYEHLAATPFRPTVKADIERGFELALRENAKPIINILGDWTWQEDTMIDLPSIFHDRADLFPQDLQGLLDAKS